MQIPALLIVPGENSIRKYGKSAISAIAAHQELLPNL